MSDETIVVFIAQGELEEQQIRSFLGAHGIPTWVRGEALRKTHAFLLDGLGQVEIMVAPDDEERARDLLARAERGELAIDEVDGSEDSVELE